MAPTLFTSSEYGEASVDDMNYLIVSDIPTPWREPVFERVYERMNGAVQVVYFKNNEKRRLWTFQMGSHPKTILKAITLTVGSERFLNPGIVPLMLRRRPDVALVCASLKDPTAWLALALCRVLGTKVILLADTWLGRDRGIGAFQRLARRLVYNTCGDAFVGASRQTLAMFKHYNQRIVDEQCFLSHLVADNSHFDRQLAGHPQERRFDVMFSGRIVKLKNPSFFAQVCAAIKTKRGRCRVLVIGDGEVNLKDEMREIFDRHGVEYQFAGFVPHHALPDHYAQSRLLLMPTSGDCWGVVINEAMAAGTPVITTEWTAAAGELVLHNGNGFVLPLDVDVWASAASDLLSSAARWDSFSRRAREMAKEFDYDRASKGIVDAFTYLSARPQ